MDVAANRKDVEMLLASDHVTISSDVHYHVY